MNARDRVYRAAVALQEALVDLLRAGDDPERRHGALTTVEGAWTMLELTLEECRPALERELGDAGCEWEQWRERVGANVVQLRRAA